MALQEKHRTRLYGYLVEHIDEETAEAVLSQFPSRDLDEPVTKEFVALQGAELRTELADLRAELKDELHTQTDRVINRLQIVGAIAVVGLSVVNALVG